MSNDKLNEKNYKQEFHKLIGNKIDRDLNSKYGRKWKPYKYMTFEEKKRMADRESIKDHRKHVRKNILTLFRS